MMAWVVEIRKELGSEQIHNGFLSRSGRDPTRAHPPCLLLFAAEPNRFPARGGIPLERTLSVPCCSHPIQIVSTSPAVGFAINLT